MDYEKVVAIQNDEHEYTSKAEGELGNDNHNDAADMLRLGKKQEFKRNFGLLSTLGFISIYMATWEFTLVSLGIGFVDGGFAGLFWTYLGTMIVYSSVVLSLAEMASMAPTSGGQYHWVSEFAPESSQKFLSYIAGWMSTLGWLASTASSVFVVTTLIENIIEVLNPSFIFPNWQYTLIMLALLVITIFLNTWGALFLPVIETISLFGHLLGFLVVLIPIVVLNPKNSTADVFTSFSESGGWGSIGLACLISQSTMLYANLGSDSIVHIAEEVQNASWTVPRVMWWSYVLNSILGLAAVILMTYCIGSLDDARQATSPFLQLVINSGSTGVALALTIILLLLIFAGNITCLATTSREMFAFARDRGLPFSSWLSKINAKIHVPFNAVYAVSVLSGVICLIDLGSTFAFNIVVSLNLLALVSTYMLSIGCVCYKRAKGLPLPVARWSLGRMGLPINVLAVVYCFFVIIFSCFPGSAGPTVSTANWAPLVWAGVLAISICIYFVYGRRHYTAPVFFVEGKRMGALQSSG